MFRPLFAPLLAILTLAGTTTSLAADQQSRAADPGAAGPAVHQRAASAADPETSRPEIALLLVLAFASVGGGVGLIAAGRGAAESPPRA